MDMANAVTTKAKKQTRPVIKNDEGIPIVGWLVNWSTEKFTIERDDLIKLFKQVGMPDDIAREVIPKNAAIRAIREKAKGRDTFHRKVADQDDKMSVVIAETQVDHKDLDARFSTATKSVFDKTTRKLVVEGKSKKEIEELFERNKTTYASDQFRSVILRYVKRYCYGITYLDTGNIYFVPASAQADLDKLQKLFALLGNKAKLCVKEEADTKQIRRIMWEVTIGEVQDQVRKLKTDLDELPDEIKEQQIDTRLRKYRDLKNRVDMYETVLRGKADDLKKDLEDLTLAIRNKLVDDE
jgi:hypothetical protein